MDNLTVERPGDTATRATAIFAALERRTMLLVGMVFVITAALAVPFLTMAPTESASTEPGGAVFDARDLVDERFVGSVRAVGFIAEHDSGDLLRAEPLQQLLQAQRGLQADPELGPTLYRYDDIETGLAVHGVRSIADLVERNLTASGLSLAAATDAQVDAAVADLVAEFGVEAEILGLSQQTTFVDGRWVSPAISFGVAADDTILGFGNTSVNLGGGTESEEYDRELQESLRAAEGWDIYGIAIALNLTSQEQGAIAGPFIGFTVLAALLIVGITFRSYWIMATVSVMFLVLLIWLKGLLNLLGFEDDLVLALIVPVAMISFGVDYAFHSVGRYREERAAGQRASKAAVTGAAAVSSALVLATASDSVAFLANTTAGIESIVQFGVGAAIALFGAYVLLGVVTPLVVAWIEANVAAPCVGRGATAFRVFGAVGAAMMAMASVLLLVFVLPWLGLVLAALTALATLVIPAIVQRRRRTSPAVGDLALAGSESPFAERIGAIVAQIASFRHLVVPAALVVSVIATFFALQIPARFDVEDFFSTDADFVQSLELIDEHVGDRGGEPAKFYVEGDLTNPDSLAKLASRIEEVRALDTPSLARVESGVAVYGGVFDVFEATGQSPVMANIVTQRTGVVVTDDNGDGIPDTTQQVARLIALAQQTGIPADADRLAMTPDEVRVAVDLGSDGRPDATVFEVRIVDSRNQSSVTSARAALEPIAQSMSTDLGDSFVQVTGSAFVREASLEGTARALAVSLPVAILACLAVATFFLRSIRYGLASIVPILMVVAWLYAFMELTGYAINLVTATIAAVSIGIGIDFALHYISRYREELDRHGSRDMAVRIAGEGTGLALVASAVSSAVGFSILAFAPMPLFASYGFLTAVMILMALVATLAVLPSLLMLITSDVEPAKPASAA